MRLLNTITRRLGTFYGEDIPGYAILSHMWGKEEDEVLFRHIAGSDADKSEGKMRHGYAKIEGACKQAIEDGWKYIWIDTCCIDKASSAELSEAINSMFEWYQNSEVCYVYLEDVESSGDGQAKSDTNTTFPIVPFERSRWFTRGWTLQELIAPQFVVFYSKDWTDIGTRASLQVTISAVTRIRVDILVAYDPEGASVAEKMSWAAFRKTTRVEDIAYCLMGLLGVNMPLLYGEGNRAFRRLQEEFMKVSDDDSLFTWRSHLEYIMEGSRGMLANSPWEFRDGIDILRSKDGAYSPYSMTNQGLQIKLPLLPIDPKRELIGFDIGSENTFKAILKCTYIGNGGQVAIYLKKIRDGYYERILQRWLSWTETPPDETELITLLVPQGTLTIRNFHLQMSYIEAEILPTVSGFTYNGRSLVDGYKDKLDLYFKRHDVIHFERQEKCFGVAIGRDIKFEPDQSFLWLDFIDIIGEEESYDDLYGDRGSRPHLRRRYLDRLSEKIPGENWWVTVSLKKIKSSRHNSRVRIVIDFQRDEAKVPPAILASGGVSSNFPANYYSGEIHPDFKKEGNGWLALFNHVVKRLLDIDLVYTLPHRSEVFCAQFSWDGKYFVTSSDILQVYDTETGTKILHFISESTKIATIYSICFSPNNKLVATGDNDGCIKLWDIGTARIHKVLQCTHRETVYSIYFSFDGHFLIAGLKYTVQIWEIDNDTSRILTIPSDHRVSITSVTISPNGSFVATGSSEGIIYIWNIKTTQLLEELQKHGDDITCIAFTPDGKGLVSGSDEGTLKYWDTRGFMAPTGVKNKFDGLSDSGTSSMVASSNVHRKSRLRWVIKIDNETHATSIAVSHDRQWVISGLANGRYVFWDMGDTSSHFSLSLAGSTTYVPLLSASSAGNIFATFKKGDDIVRICILNDIHPQKISTNQFIGHYNDI